MAEFEESKRQITEMEDKGYLSTDGFEGTLKIKTVELEPRMNAVEKQFSDARNRLEAQKSLTLLYSDPESVLYCISI